MLYALLSSYPDVRYSMTAEHMDEVRDGIEAGEIVRGVDADGADVGGFARQEGADLGVESEGAGAVQCGHPQH
jgi:hypothetical protein